MKDIAPRYAQKTFRPEDRINKLQEVVTPDTAAEGVWINQDAWFYLGTLRKDFSTTYPLKKDTNGVYIFVIDGEVVVNDQVLNKRDGFGVWDTSAVSIHALSEAEMLVMEVPMNWED